MQDGQLRFRYGTVQRELREAEKLARKFLDRQSAGRMSAAADHLEILRHRSGEHEWGLTEADPLVTLPSRGYEKGHRRGAHMLQASISSTWFIKIEDKSTFRVTGNVSTRVRLTDSEDGQELGRWRVELGAENSPGCFFHTQIRGQDEDRSPPWPHSVPVPRLPTPFISIPSVLVFVLGELFQTDWAQHVNNKRSERLAADQRRDWERRLAWELEAIRSKRTLPWSSLKAAVPHRNLFVDPELEPGLRAHG